MEKQRLDVLLVALGLAESRQRAKLAISSGLVCVDGKRVDKPSSAFPADAKVELRGEALKYVSRGGLKLEKALEVFSLDIRGAVAIDVGASTGGFTDCMLMHGVEHVFAVDVGHGQLSDKLRKSPRVTVMEDTDIRNVGQLEPLPDFATVDVSFISLSLVLQPVYRILSAGGRAVVLVKPQVEAGKGRVGKRGVVRSPEVHADVLKDFAASASGCGFSVAGLDYSPVTGAEGNIEYLALLTKAAVPYAVDIRGVVEKAHASLRREH